MQYTKKKERLALAAGCGIALALILFAVFAKFGDSSPSVSTGYKAVLARKELLARMRLQLLKSVEMEKSAVMALANPKSVEYANQSRVASAAVDQDLAALRSLVDNGFMANEKKLFEEFAVCWMELGKVDQITLLRTVANANLRAAVLSRGRGEESMHRFEEALASIHASSAGSPDAGQVAVQASRALIAALKIFNLHTPYIIEVNSAEMGLIETRIHAEEQVASQSLAALEELSGNEKAEEIAQAKASFAEFVDVTSQVMQLSRQNSDIASLMLSLEKKRIIAAQCDDILTALEETINHKTSEATR